MNLLSDWLGTAAEVVVPATASAPPPAVVVVGKESVGKSQLLAALTGRASHAANFRGSTVACEEYVDGPWTWVDTPGLARDSDADTARRALARLAAEETALVVVQATHLDEDLADLLPLVRGKRIAVVVSFWDKVAPTAAAHAALGQLQSALAAPVVAVDARRVGDAERQAIRAAVGAAALHAEGGVRWRAGWRIEPRTGWFEQPVAGPILAATALLAPAAVAVWLANTVAGVADPLVRTALAPAVQAIDAWPEAWSLPRAVVAGPYGLLTMGPLLLVWAVPTVVAYAVLLGAYKASGLVDRLSAALHPWVRPCGLAGRDLTRIVMGFGCNVPAVISTRSCSGCTRGTCISAIAFGSACSYQLPATLAVFASLDAAWLAAPLLGYLLVSTVVYLRLVSEPAARSALNRLLVERRTFLEWPRPAALWREARGTLAQFFGQALPVFVVLSAGASALEWCGALGAAARWIAPAMQAFRLPGEAALPVVLASVRKDGILLLAAPSAAPLGPWQALVGAYLAGVLLPCLVTVLTIAREQSWAFAGRLVARQAAAAVIFALVLAWAGALMGY